MRKVFTSDADFSGLLKDDQNLEITKVFHKAYISFDEKGTEATGSTGNC